MNIYESIKKNTLTESTGYSEFRSRVLAVYEKLAKKATPVSVFLIWNELRNGKGSEKNDEFFPGTEEADNFDEDYALIRKILKGKKLKESEKLSETNYLKKYYNQLDTMTDKELYRAWLEVKDAPDEEGGPEEIEYTLASDALWEIEGELCRRGYMDEDSNKTDKWKELEDMKESEEGYQVWQKYYDEDGLPAKPELVTTITDYEKAMQYCDGLMKDPNCEAWIVESSDVAKDLAIEPGSVEEEILNGLYEEKKIEWSDLGGSDQTAVEHYFSHYGRDFTGKSWNDVEGEIRSACHEIGYANEELIEDGYWMDGDMDPEPNEKLVKDYIFYNSFIPFINKKGMNESSDIGARKNQLVRNIEYLIDEYYNGILDGYYEPFKTKEELIDYVYSQVFDLKSDGEGGVKYNTGISKDSRYLGRDYIHGEIVRIGTDSGVLQEAVGTSPFLEISRKSVPDSDGFTTDYVLYHDTINDKYVTVFGDQDIYRPEDGDYDMEFDKEDEAKEWFDSYDGLTESDNSDLPSIEDLKKKLKDLANQDFMHEMGDHWDHEDFEISHRLHRDIKKTIDLLAKHGVYTEYHLGHPFRFSDEIKKEADESKPAETDRVKWLEDALVSIYAYGIRACVFDNIVPGLTHKDSYGSLMDEYRELTGKEFNIKDHYE